MLKTDQETFNNAPNVDINVILPATGQPAGDWDAEISSYWQGGGIASNTPAVDGTLSADTTVIPGTGGGAGLVTGTPGPGLATATVTGNATAMPEGTATLTTGGQGTRLLQGGMLATEALGSSITVANQEGIGNGQGSGTGAGAATATPGTSGGAGVVTATTSGTDQGNSGLGSAEATIDDLIIDTSTGDIQYIVLDTMIDSSETWIPVPFSLLQWDATHQGFVVNVNPAALGDAPSFGSGQYPDTSTSGWDSDISPFWQSNGTGQGSDGGSGTNSQAIATPTP